MAESQPSLVAPRRARVRVVLGAAVVLVLTALGGAVIASLASPRGGAIAVAAPTGSFDVDGSGAAAAPLTVVVHVLGAVAEPGLYRLTEGARVVDAIGAAGGFTAEAERGALNLARVLLDAEQVIVPVIGAVPSPGTGGSGITGDGRVNLNTADQAALETLPGVGPALAARILAWRQANGGFRSVEDLLQVSGIGQRTLDGMRDRVAV